MTSIAGMILAGGASSRFGSNKALAIFKNKQLIVKVVDSLRPFFEKIYVITKEPNVYSFLGKDIIILQDTLPEPHALIGLYSGLKQIEEASAFVCGCDMPFLNPALIEKLCSLIDGYDAVIPQWSGKKQPLCAVYSKKCAETIGNMLKNNESEHSLHELLSRIKTKFLTQEETAVYDPQGKSFDDIDTKADYEYASTR